MHIIKTNSKKYFKDLLLFRFFSIIFIIFRSHQSNEQVSYECLEYQNGQEVYFQCKNDYQKNLIRSKVNQIKSDNQSKSTFTVDNRKVKVSGNEIHSLTNLKKNTKEIDKTKIDKKIPQIIVGRKDQ